MDSRLCLTKTNKKGDRLNKVDKKMKKVTVVGLILVLFVTVNTHAVEWGNWTNVTYIYTKTDAALPFVQFKPGSMPGCYQDAGGYLEGDDVDKAYSTVLAALMGGREIRPLYEIRSDEGWGMCRIKSIYIR